MGVSAPLFASTNIFNNSTIISPQNLEQYLFADLYAKQVSTHSAKLSSFKTDISKVVTELTTKKIITDAKTNNDAKEKMYSLAGMKNSYFLFNLVNNINGANNTAQLIINTENLYIEGFIVGDSYYHFSDSAIKKIDGVKKETNLGYSSNYNSLIGSQQLPINQSSLTNSVIQISKFDGKKPNDLKKALGMVILSSSESLRFYKIRNAVSNIATKSGVSGEWQKDFKNILINWDTFSKKFYKNDQKDAKKSITILNKNNYNYYIKN